MPILISIFLLFASAFLVAPSAKQPCACVDLAPGESSRSEAEDDSSEKAAGSRPQPESKPSKQPSVPSTGSTDDSVSSGFPGFTPQKDKIDGYQEIPWGASVKEVKRELGEPTYGHLNSWKVVTKKWQNEHRFHGLPSNVSKVLLYKKISFLPKYLDRKANLLVGFINKNGENRFAYAFIDIGDKQLGDYENSFSYNYTKNTINRTLKNRFGKPDPQVGEHDENLTIWGRCCINFYHEWTDDLGYAGFTGNHGDWLTITLQAKPLKDPDAEFRYPPTQKTTETKKSTGDELASGLEGERFGNKVQETQDGRIDGFRSLPWGSTPSAVESEMGAPSTRKARETEPYNSVKNMSFPDEGEKVWAYEQEILGEKAYIYVAFDRFHVNNDLGLVWAATAWDANENIDKKEDAQRIYNELRNKIFVNDFGEPSLTDENEYTETEKPKFWTGGWWSTNRWKDEYGRLHLRGRPGDEGVMVYFQSGAMIEKRKSEVEEAESKF